MKTILGALVLIAMVAMASPTEAIEPPPAPATLWSFLGIPQGVNKIRDATVNRRGNLPGLERKPALKALADPANLESKNVAIQTAAKIKQQEDLAPQKVKALKYLATVGCGCYPDVKKALLAGLMDCTEVVRYEAAVAICESAGNPCKTCESDCCSAEIVTQLNKMAHGRDEFGCCEEPSARVRAAAAGALRACPNPGPDPELPSPEMPTRALPAELPTAPIPGSQTRGLPPDAPIPADMPRWMPPNRSNDLDSPDRPPVRMATPRTVSPIGWAEAKSSG